MLEQLILLEKIIGFDDYNHDSRLDESDFQIKKYRDIVKKEKYPKLDIRVKEVSEGKYELVSYHDQDKLRVLKIEGYKVGWVSIMEKNKNNNTHKQIKIIVEDLASDQQPSTQANKNPAKGAPSKKFKKKDEKDNAAVKSKDTNPKDTDTDVNTDQKEMELTQAKNPPLVSKDKNPPQDLENQLPPEDKITLGSKTPVIIDPSLNDTMMNTGDDNAIDKSGKKIKDTQDKESLRKESVAYKVLKKLKSEKKAKQPTELNDITVGVTNEDFLAKMLASKIRNSVKQGLIKKPVMPKSKLKTVKTTSNTVKAPKPVSAPAKVNPPATPPTPSASTTAHAQSVISGGQNKSTSGIVKPPKPTAIKPPKAPKKTKDEKQVDIPMDPDKIKELIKKNQLPVRARKVSETLQLVRSLIEAKK